MKEGITLFGGIVRVHAHAHVTCFWKTRRKSKKIPRNENVRDEKSAKRAKLIPIENSIAMEEKKKKAAKGKMMVASDLQNSEETDRTPLS